MSLILPSRDGGAPRLAHKYMVAFRVEYTETDQHGTEQKIVLYRNAVVTGTKFGPDEYVALHNSIRSNFSVQGNKLGEHAITVLNVVKMDDV